MSSYVVNDDIYIDDFEIDPNIILSEEELLELKLLEEEYLRQEALDEEENRNLIKKKFSDPNYLLEKEREEKELKEKQLKEKELKELKELKEKEKKEKKQGKKGLSLEEFNKKIEDNAPKKFISKRLLEKNPELVNQVKPKEVQQNNMRRFNPRLPPFRDFRSK